MKRTKKDGTPTKQFKEYMNDCYNRYIKSDIDNIYKAYFSPSNSKIATFNFWKRMHKNVKIISYNTSFFTVAFINESPQYFTVVTPDNCYSIDLEYINPLTSR